MEIKKKVVKKIFQDILDGKKKFEIRLANFEINVGDTLILLEEENGKLTGREIRKKAGYILKTKELPYWKEEDINKYGYQVIQLEDLE